jgi:hypothetical protein
MYTVHVITCYVYNIKLWPEAYKSPAHLRREPDLVMFVYNTIQFCRELHIATTHQHMEWWLTFTVWQLSQYSDSLEAGPHAVCLLAEAGDFLSLHFLSLQYIRPAVGSIWTFIQWILLILPNHSISCCMSLVTHLYFLLRLQISAVATVLPLYVFMVYTVTSLPFTIVFEEWLQYLHGHNSVPQKMRAVWNHGTVCNPTVLCCVKTQSVIWWSVSNVEAWKPLWMWHFLLCNAHLLHLSVTFSSSLAP